MNKQSSVAARCAPPPAHNNEQQNSSKDRRRTLQRTTVHTLNLDIAGLLPDALRAIQFTRVHVACPSPITHHYPIPISAPRS
eukprot:2435340-Prymnesium_polylepis.1